MPTDSQGNYTIPAGTLVSSGETIAPSQHNPAFLDVEQALTDRLSRDGRGAMRANLQGGGFRATGFANGVQDTDLATVAQINAGGGLPAGSVIEFAGTSAPTGWLFCAGQTLSRASYADLFGAIGTAYGAPDSSTFKLPDCRGRVTAGRDIDSGGFAGRLTTPNSQTIGATGGAETVTLTEAQMPVHTHAVTGDTNAAGGHSHEVDAFDGDTVLVGNGANLVLRAGGGAYPTSGVANHTHTISVSAADAGSGAAHSNVQPVIVMSKIIKTSNV